MTQIVSASGLYSRRPLLALGIWLCTLPACSDGETGEDTATYTEHSNALTSPDDALQLPAPRGPFAVGVRTRFLEDPSRREESGRPRALPISVWYPALHSDSARTAPYLPPLIRQGFEHDLDAAPGTFDIDTRSQLNAPALSRVRGVLLVSGGYQAPVAFYTALVTDLASQGWVLVGVDHPHDTFAVEQPDGSVIPSSLSSTEGFPERLLDVGIVLRHLPELVPHYSRALPVGMLGHSLGGAAALESLRLYPVLGAAANLDGTPRGEVVNTGLREPFAVLLSTVRIVDQLDDTELTAFLTHSTGPRRIKQLHNVYHSGLSDFATLNPQILQRDPELYARLEVPLRTDVTSVAVGNKSIATQREFVSDFFDRFLARRR